MLPQLMDTSSGRSPYFLTYQAAALPSGTLFPQEITQYDPWVIREALHNAIAHQDYRRHGRIVVVEFPDRVLLTNVGDFLPGDVETVIRQDAPQALYRNPFLADAMVELNLIDTQGSGIKRMFETQRRRSFPLPELRPERAGARRREPHRTDPRRALHPAPDGAGRSRSRAGHAAGPGAERAAHRSGRPPSPEGGRPGRGPLPEPDRRCGCRQGETSTGCRRSSQLVDPKEVALSRAGLAVRPFRQGWWGVSSSGRMPQGAWTQGLTALLSPVEFGRPSKGPSKGRPFRRRCAGGADMVRLLDGYLIQWAGGGGAQDLAISGT